AHRLYQRQHHELLFGAHVQAEGQPRGDDRLDQVHDDGELALAAQLDGDDDTCDGDDHRVERALLVGGQVEPEHADRADQHGEQVGVPHRIPPEPLHLEPLPGLRGYSRYPRNRALRSTALVAPSPYTPVCSRGGPSSRGTPCTSAGAAWPVPCWA